MGFIKWLDKNFEKYVLMSLLVVIVCVMSYMVVMRFVFNNAPFWSDRVAQYSFVISTFFSISYCIRRGSSLKIDILLKAVPSAVSKVMSVCVKVLMLVFFSLLTYAAWGVIESFVQLGTRDTALDIPMYYFYSVTFFALVLTTIRCVQTLVFEFFPEKNPEILASIAAPPSGDKK
ncbi:MAG: TRAP transporter small permease [Defluviitaleaceae bacterium]|nr:TRAP transporter small permease [Defluviitaleaceae bacterium]